MCFSFDVFGDDPDPVVHDLEKSTPDREPTHVTCPTNTQRTLTKKRHERRVIRQDADLAIEGGRNHRIRLTVEHRGLG